MDITLPTDEFAIAHGASRFAKAEKVAELRRKKMKGGVVQCSTFLSFQFWIRPGSSIAMHLHFLLCHCPFEVRAAQENQFECVLFAPAVRTFGTCSDVCVGASSSFSRF